MRFRIISRVLVCVLSVVVACAHVRAEPTVRLETIAGPGLTVEVSITDLGINEVAGYQIFMQYNALRFAFVSGQYVTDCYGLPLVSPITASGGKITLAGGVNAFSGQQPTSVDCAVAILHFQVLDADCIPEVLLPTNISPPTRLTTPQGQEIAPLRLISIRRGCTADYNADTFVSVDDLFIFLNDYFLGSCRADIDGLNGVAIDDLFLFLNAWFVGCP